MNEQTPVTMEERLKSIAHKFLSLYDRLSEDREKISKQSNEMTNLMGQFSQEVDRFKNLKTEFHKEIRPVFESATQNTFKELGSHIGKEAHKALEETVSDLKRSVGNAKDALRDYKRESTLTYWKVSLSVILASALICVGTLVAFLFIQNPLTDEQIRLIHLGEITDKVWPELSTAEKAKFDKITLSEAH